MNSVIISIHPQIKKTINSLDFDLGLELSRFEQSINPDFSLADANIDHQDTAITSVSTLVYHPETIENEEEPISVASRLIDEPSSSLSLLDLILTPWGIFGILLFFSGSLFFFVNPFSSVNVNPPVAMVKDTGNFPSPSENNIHTNPNYQDNIKTIDNSSSPIPQNSSSPTLEINPLPSANSLENPPHLSPYPDLKTALFNEIKKNNLSLSSIDNSLPPSNPSPVTSSKYYLVTDYQNFEYFKRLQEIIPSAVIVTVNQQQKIQLGIFATETEAVTRSKELSNQGINNQVMKEKTKS